MVVGPSPGDGNLVSGNSLAGIVIQAGTTGNVVQGSWVGLNAAGTGTIANNLTGIAFIDGATNNSAIGNVVSGNVAAGISFSRFNTPSTGAISNTVRGNLIGTDPTGTLALGNIGPGVHFDTNSSGNTIGGTNPGDGNLIANNTGPGIEMLESGSVNNRIRGNSIHSKGGLGIDLAGDGVTANDPGDADTGPNSMQNFPVLTAAEPGAATRIVGIINSTPNATLILDFYASATLDASGFGEGARWLGTLTFAADAAGNASFDNDDLAATSSSEWITATATDAAGSTSEFSQAISTNSPPTASTDGPHAIAEGDGLTLSAAGFDPDGDTLAYSWDINDDGTFGDAVGPNPTLSWNQLQSLGIDDGPDSFAVRVRVDDGHGHVVASSATTLSLSNSDPAASISPPANAVPGQSRTFVFGPFDPSRADQAAGFTFNISWGDGTTETVMGLDGKLVDHTYGATGTYFVEVTATDKDGGASAAVSQSFTVTAIAVQGSDLAVGGTPGNDTITVLPGGHGQVAIGINGSTPTTHTVNGSILLYGVDGNDGFVISATWNGGLWLDGQSGTDTITVNFGNLAGMVTVSDSGTSGSDRLDANGTSAPDDLVKTATLITRGDPVVETIVYSGMERLQVDGSAGDDRIRDPGEDTTILGGDGNVIIEITATAGTGITIDGGDGSDAVQVYLGELDGPVTVSDSGTSGADTLTVFGTAGNDAVVLDNSSLNAGGEVLILDAGLDALLADGGGGNNQFTSASSSVVPTKVRGVDGVAIDGTAGDDHIVVTPGTASGDVAVLRNGVSMGSFAGSTRLVLFGLAGDDDLQIGGGVLVPVWLHGGSGNDRLRGGGAHDVILAGVGDDLLVGGGGRELLIGGLGAHRIVGNADDDILLGGSTVFDAAEAALVAIMAEWTSSRAFATRRANLNGVGSGPRDNESYFLRTTTIADVEATILDDAAADVLTRASAEEFDWYFLGVGDRATDLGDSAFSNDLEFING